ncbi:MAG: hypothetical protein NVS3B16_21580 [Vulcanimicrobiaceae bacterium]
MKRFLASFLAAFVFAVALAAAPAYAQNASPAAALPTAPGAQKAAEGGLSQAPASLPGNGASPLEPYLVTWLLPVAGVIVAIVFVTVDKRLRATGGRL